MKKRIILNLDKNKKYLLACSFGPDSMALFHMCLSIGIHPIICHVNYHKRDEAEYESLELEKYCEKNNCSFYRFDCNKHEHGNFQKWARDMRYSFFSEIYRKEKADILLVAHNLDDFLETYLIKKQQGRRTSIYGISVDSENFSMRIQRPLLNYEKKELLEYCFNNNVPFAIDSSNMKNTYQRNRIRHEKIECLSYKEKQQMYKDIQKENEQIKQKETSIAQKFNGCKELKINTLLKCDLSEIGIATYLLFKNANLLSFYTNHQNCNAINMIRSTKPNISVRINDNFKLIKEYDVIRIIPKNVVDYEYKMEKPAKLDNEYFYADFSFGASNRNIVEDSYPLTIRNAKPSDLVCVKDYYVTARRLFIDWKMPKQLRERWPVIIDRYNRIIYIPRYRKDYRVKESENFFVK